MGVEKRVADVVNNDVAASSHAALFYPLSITRDAASVRVHM